MIKECLSCGAVNTDNAQFCANCGEQMLSICPSCKARNDSVARYCRECGADMSPKSKADAIPVTLPKVEPAILPVKATPKKLATKLPKEPLDFAKPKAGIEQPVRPAAASAQSNNDSFESKKKRVALTASVILIGTVIAPFIFSGMSDLVSSHQADVSSAPDQPVTVAADSTSLPVDNTKEATQAAPSNTELTNMRPEAWTTDNMRLFFAGTWSEKPGNLGALTFELKFKDNGGLEFITSDAALDGEMAPSGNNSFRLQINKNQSTPPERVDLFLEIKPHEPNMIMIYFPDAKLPPVLIHRVK